MHFCSCLWPGCDFYLSDAPFSNLVSERHALLTNCAYVSGWSCTHEPTTMLEVTWYQCAPFRGFDLEPPLATGLIKLCVKVSPRVIVAIVITETMVPKVFPSAAWQLYLRANKSFIVSLTYWPMIPLNVGSFSNLHCRQYLIANTVVYDLHGRALQVWWCHVTFSGKKVDTQNAIMNQMKYLETLAFNVCPSLTSQTQHFHRTGK